MERERNNARAVDDRGFGRWALLALLLSVACAPTTRPASPPPCAGIQCAQSKGDAKSSEAGDRVARELDRMRSLPAIDQPTAWYVHSRAQWTDEFERKAKAELAKHEAFEPSVAEGAWAFAQPGHEADVQLLVSLRLAPSHWVREVAFVALAMLGDEWAVNQLILARPKRWNELTQSLARNAGAATLLGMAGRAEPKVTSLTCQRMDGVWKLVRRLGDVEAADTILERLRRHDGHWDHQVVLALAELLDERAAPLLVRLLDHIPADESSAPFWLDEILPCTRPEARIQETQLIGKMLELTREGGSHRQHLVELFRPAILRRQTDSVAVIQALGEFAGEEAMKRLRALAFPRGQQPGGPKSDGRLRALAFPEAQEPVARAYWALQALGSAHDEASFDELLRTLRRRSVVPDTDRQLRRLRKGAAEALALWGNPPAREALLDVALDVNCIGLDWLSSVDQRLALARQALAQGKPGSLLEGRSACLLHTVASRLTPGLSDLLIEAFKTRADLHDCMGLGYWLAQQELAAQHERYLEGWLEDKVRGPGARLALIAAGRPALATRAFHLTARNPDAEPRVFFRLIDAWPMLVSTWDEDLDNGRLFRWVRNVLHVGEAAKPSVFIRMTTAFGGNWTRNPRALSRVRLKRRLYELARSAASPEAAQGPVDALVLLGAYGPLLSLLRQPGPAQGPARLGFRRLDAIREDYGDIW